MRPRFVSFALIGGILLAIVACNDTLQPEMLRVQSLAHSEDCPWERMPGGWCFDEWIELEDQIFRIEGDSTCNLMRTKLYSWLQAGYIRRSPDLHPDTKASTTWHAALEFHDRLAEMHINPNYRTRPISDLGKSFRHEYGHVHSNKLHSEGFNEFLYEGSCGGGGPNNGGGLPSPAGPMQ